MDIIFVRHGESEANARGVIQGRGDYCLTEKGRDQALGTARALREFRPYRIYTSPLLRARETAEIINRPHNAEIAVLDDLMEYSLGEFEGKTNEELLRCFPSLPEELRRGVPFHHLAPGAETDDAAALRAERALHEVLDSGLPRVIVVSHLGILEQMIRLALAEFKFDPHPLVCRGPLLHCAITRIEFNFFSARLLKFNDASHIH